MAESQKKGSKSLIAEIDELQKRIEAMGYMDEAIEDMSWMDDDLETVGIEDVELGDPEEVEVIDETEFMDMDDDEEYWDDDDEEYCDGRGPVASDKAASLKSPGIEDEITQDYLSEMVNLVHGEELDTDDSMLDAARNGSEEAVKLLKRASARLDRVATYLEKNGRAKQALRIDMIADAIDARINGGQE